MLEITLIAVGGALGTVCRYALLKLAWTLFGRDFPWGVLVVNLMGSFILGAMVVLLATRFQLPPEWRLGLFVGFLGGLTTFSTFSVDTLQFFEQGAPLKATANIFFNVVLCIAMAWLGGQLARYVNT